MKPSRYFIQFEDKSKVEAFVASGKSLDHAEPSDLYSTMDVADVPGKTYTEWCENAHEFAKLAAGAHTGHAGVYERRGLYDAGDYVGSIWVENWEWQDEHVSDCTSEVCE